MPVPLTEEETKNRQLALLKYLSKQDKPIPAGFMGFTITPEMQASIDQAVAQAQRDADQIAAREAEFAPFTQLGLIGQQLAQIQPGAFPTQTVGYAPPAAPASPMSQFLTGAAGIGGIAGKLGLFG